MGIQFTPKRAGHDTPFFAHLFCSANSTLTRTGQTSILSRFSNGGISVNVELIEKARVRVPSVPVLVNLVSKRVRQLNMGERPLVKPLSADEDKSDIALREIADGLLISEVDFSAIARAEQAHSRWSE
jgi:DNA-directed RNA polymerase subunit omega